MKKNLEAFWCEEQMLDDDAAESVERAEAKNTKRETCRAFLEFGSPFLASF